MNKKTIFVFILCLVVCIIPTFSKASSKIQIVKAPKIQYEVSNEKKFVIKLIDNNKITSIYLEKIENGKSTVLVNKNAKSDKVAKGITISKDMKNIKLTTNTYLKTDYIKFKLVAYNDSIAKNKIVTYFNVKKYVNKNENNKWYGVNNSPQLSYANGLTVTVKDNYKIKNLIIKDRNNKNKKINIGKELAGSTEIIKSYKIDLSKLVAKNNVYSLEVTAEDLTGLKKTEKIMIKKEVTVSNTNKKQIKTNLNSVQVQATGVTLDKTVLMLDTDHYNVATLKATIKPSNVTNKAISWSSSDTNIAKVDAHGNIKAKKAGTVIITAKTSNGKIAECSLKVITHMKKVSSTTPGAVEGQGNRKGTYWLVKKEKFSAEQVEAYINNAEKLCKIGDYKKYPESEATEIPIYRKSTGEKELLNKKKGISATNYLILVTSTNQKLYMLQKQNGIWKKYKEADISTANYSPGNHNRFDFYIGATYINPEKKTPQANEFWQCLDKNKDYSKRKLDGTNIIEPYASHRTLHLGTIYPDTGAPSSNGCVHVPKSILNYIRNNKSELLGSRIIVY